MSDSMQFCELADASNVFIRMFRAALESLAPDLADAPWFIREREVVNLFVFRHLVPRFQAEGLDIAQIGIEIPLPKMRDGEREKPGSGADLVIWPHRKATIWRRCKPLVRIEWKNVSCREKQPWNLMRGHREDITFLQRNIDGAILNYAVLTSRCQGKVSVACQYVLPDRQVEFASFTQPATGDESDLHTHRHLEDLLRLSPCQRCVCEHSTGATSN